MTRAKRKESLIGRKNKMFSYLVCPIFLRYCRNVVGFFDVVVRWSQKLICFVDFEGRHIFPTAIRIDVVNPEADLFVSGNRKPERVSLDLNKTALPDEI